jgi:hypothetical protein
LPAAALVHEPMKAGDEHWLPRLQKQKAVNKRKPAVRAVCSDRANNGRKALSLVLMM